MIKVRKPYTPQEYIHIGMAFFLLGIFVSQVADGRLLGELFANMLPESFSADAIQGMAAGFSIPIFCASIYFNLNGLVMFRSK